MNIDASGRWLIKCAVRNLRRFGLDVQRTVVGSGIALQRPESRKPSLDRPMMSGALSNAVRAGLTANTVFDVGAAVGTPALWAAFPTSHFVLVEPLAELIPRLTSAAEAALRSFEVFPGLVGSACGTATLHVHDDLVGSSTYTEAEHVNGLPRQVEQRTLTQLTASPRVSPPYVIKVDTQGSELDVLNGALPLLADTVCLVLEASLLPFFAGAPLAGDLIAELAGHGFVLYDIVDPAYRPLDLALGQVDLVFIRRDSTLRRDARYATEEQRMKQTRRLTPRLHERTRG